MYFSREKQKLLYFSVDQPANRRKEKPTTNMITQMTTKYSATFLHVDPFTK